MATHEPMLEMFLFETRQFLEQLEQVALESEQRGSFNEDAVNEIFRAMHTIKGSAAMMMYNEVSSLAHAVEDIFYYIRELKPKIVDVSQITDFVLSATDFMNGELDKVDGGGQPDASSEAMRQEVKTFLRGMKEANGDDPDVDLRKKKPSAQKEEKAKYYIPAAPAKAAEGKQQVFAAVIHFEEGCEMVEVRAYGVVHALQEQVDELHYLPQKILEDDLAADAISKDGFRLWFTTKLEESAVKQLLEKTSFLRKLSLQKLNSTAECEYWPSLAKTAAEAAKAEPIRPEVEPSKRQAVKAKHEAQMISVRVDKLDRLLDLVGELVIAESMVTQNPDLQGLELTNFAKAASQLHKINGELQDSVMAIRMVPLEATFHKMNRVVRDMTKKLGKKARLVLVGEDTEVDKNIIEHIGDPLMHIIRNSLDHGIEMPEVRKAAGKAETGQVTLAAENAGGEVVIRIMDDGAGLNKEKILERARNNHMFTKPESELTDQEIYSFIFAAGFSTKEKVTEFSGRGVGMDVVVQNLKKLGGSVTVDSEPGKGSTTTIKIPLTLAIIEGMSVALGKAKYTIPITSVRESFRPEAARIFHDPEGSEMIMVRGECYPVLKLHELYHVAGAKEKYEEGILLLVETEMQTFGLFADGLLGVQEIVVKPVPAYIRKDAEKEGISGCTLLGDGSISLILDAQLLSRQIYADNG